MNIIGLRSRVSLVLTAAVLLFQLSPGLAAGQPDAQQATIQGSRFPGLPASASETAQARRGGPAEVTFTKWRTALLPPSGPPPPGATTRFIFKGFVGGDFGAGDFVGEVVDRKASTGCAAFVPPCTDTTPPTITGPVASLEAIYEVKVDEHSFTAVIRGGSTSAGGRLEGVIVTGWRIGAHVRVAFDTVATCTDPAGVVHNQCFQGVIRVEQVPKE